MKSLKLTRKLDFWLYRVSTILKSMKTLCTLSPEKVEAFLDSYSIYDLDWANQKEMIEKLGPDYEQKIKQKIVDWYSVLNHLCAIGQVEKMYIPPAIDLSKSIIANQNLFEKRMGEDLGLKKGMKALDIGCGRGRVASHVAKLTGAHLTGINLDPSQIDSAKRYIAANDLEDQCKFSIGDINELPLPFPDASFDAIYQIEVFSLSKDLLKLFKEVNRILKPGGKIACLEWVTYDAYDPKNPHHADLVRKVKPLIGAIGTLSDKEYADVMKKAGFNMLINENPSVDGLQAPLIESADKFFNRITGLIRFLVRCRILPKYFIPMFERFIQDGEAFVEADRMRILTICHYFVAQKPQ